LRAKEIPERIAIPTLAGLVGALIANVEFAVLGSGGGGTIANEVAGALALPALGPVDVGLLLATLTIAALAAGLLAWDARQDEAASQRHFLLVLGGLVAFSAGGSQVGLAIGPLIPLLGAIKIPLWAVLAGGGLGLLAGSWTGAPRMIKAISQDYSSLGPRRSIAALIPSFAIAQAAVAFGIPVSFNEIIVSAIIGSGYAAGGSGVSRRKMMFTVLAWIGSLTLALAIGYTGFLLVDTAL
jgi:PiT family inorganic phosphate transporter